MANNKKRRNNKNKKAHQSSATATATAVAVVHNVDDAITGLLELTSMPCYHGSTVDKFSSGSDYIAVVAAYHRIFDTLNYSKKHFDSSDEAAMLLKFDTDHMKYMTDSKFCYFVFAFCTNMFLHTNFMENFPGARGILLFYLDFGLRIQYHWLPFSKATKVGGDCDIFNFNSKIMYKYTRDIHTAGDSGQGSDRGIINYLSRETRDLCNCMTSKKSEAKKMEKVAICCGCRKRFPKEKLFQCSGCTIIAYHSKECQIMDWPHHKKYCKGYARDILAESEYSKHVNDAKPKRKTK